MSDIVEQAEKIIADMQKEIFANTPPERRSEVEAMTNKAVSSFKRAFAS